jgi:hypothetical protein
MALRAISKSLTRSEESIMARAKIDKLVDDNSYYRSKGNRLESRLKDLPKK